MDKGNKDKKINIRNIESIVKGIYEEIDNIWEDRIILISEIGVLNIDKTELEEMNLNKVTFSYKVVTDELEESIILKEASILSYEEDDFSFREYLRILIEGIIYFYEDNFIYVENNSINKTSKNKQGKNVFTVGCIDLFKDTVVIDKKVKGEFILTEDYLPVNVSGVKERLLESGATRVLDVSIGEDNGELLTEYNLGENNGKYVFGKTMLRIKYEIGNAGMEEYKILVPVLLEEMPREHSKMESWEILIKGLLSELW